MVAVVAGLLVLGMVIGRWMTTPFDDWVPLDAPDELPSGVAEDDLPAAARFECARPFGAPEAIASAQAEEALSIQALSRPPCEGPRAQHRLVGLLNLVVIALACFGTFMVWRRRTSTSDLARPVPGRE